MTLSPETERLLHILQDSPRRAREGTYPVAHFLDTLGGSSGMLACLFLTLPFLQPFSVGPLATVGGLAFASIGWRMARGEAGLWLPERIRTADPGPRVWTSLAGCAATLLRVCRRLIRAGRLSWLEQRAGARWTGWLIVFAGLLMAIPFVGIPLNNTLPALVILFACLARLERDGLMTLASLLFLVLTLGYFTFLGWGILYAGGELREWIDGWRGVDSRAGA